MRFLIGTIIILGMLVVVLGLLVWCYFEETGDLQDSLHAHELSVTALESALEQKQWALDEAVGDLNDCIEERDSYEH